MSGARWMKIRSLLLAVLVGLLVPLAVAGPAQAAGARQDCAEAPTPERPGSGMVGDIDAPQGNGEPNSVYAQYSYAGLVWYVYDDNCGPLSKNITDPSTTVDTWLGNQLFNVGKNIVGATNSLHYTLLNGGVLGKLNDQIGQAADNVFNNIYAQLFSLFMLILAVLLFRSIWKGDLATVSRRTFWAFAGMWLAASTFVLVSNYGRIDDLIVTTTTGISTGFVDPNEDRVVREILPTELHTKVVYENWLRGEFDSPDSPEATQYGRELLDAQAWTWSDLVTARDADNAAEQAKKDKYKEIAGKLGPSSGTFQGTDGSRTGAGFLAMFQSIVFSLFQLLAKLAVLLAQLLLRILTLTAPVIGLVALIQPDLLRKVGRAVGTVILNVLVLAVLAGIHFRFLQLIFSEQAGISLLLQMLLAGIVTVVFLIVGRPMRRMWQMIEVSATGSVSSGGPLSRLRQRKSEVGRPQEEFWEQVRGAEMDATGPRSGHARPRPETRGPVIATATRRPRYSERDEPGSSRRAAELSSSRPPLSLPAGATPPESQSVRQITPPPARPEPPLAEVEVVDGQEVHVVYDPTRGHQAIRRSQPPNRS